MVEFRPNELMNLNQVFNELKDLMNYFLFIVIYVYVCIYIFSVFMTYLHYRYSPDSRSSYTKSI